MAASRSGAGPYSRIKRDRQPEQHRHEHADEGQFDGDDRPVEQQRKIAGEAPLAGRLGKIIFRTFLVEQPLLVVVPDAPLLVDAVQFAALGQTIQGRVELHGQRLLILAKRDGVLAGIPRRADELQFRPRFGDVRGDRPVEQHGVEPAQFQIEIGLDLIAVDLLLDAQLVQQALGGRIFERADHAAHLLARFERVETRFVGPGDQLQRVDVIRPAEPKRLDAIGRDFDAVHAEVDVAAAQAGNEILEIVLNELDAAAKLLFQRRGQIDLEALVAVRVLGILADVGRPALAVGPPAQRRQLAVARHGRRIAPGGRQAAEHTAEWRM